MSAATFADKPTLEGERVRLRPLAPEDVDAMWAATQDPDGRRLTGTRRHFTRESIERWIADAASHDDRLDLSVIDLADGGWAGDVAVMDWSPEDRSCAFRIALAPGRRDRGLGTEATRLVVDYVFERLPIDRLSLEVFSFNERAAAVYEKVGFVREGVLRDSLRWDDGVHDTILMAILRRDWERARRGG